jgi:antitoxin HicB
MNKDLEYYMNLPYTIELQNTPGVGWFVKVKELPGCMSQGDDEHEALEMIRDAMLAWLSVGLEDGLPIPEPEPEPDQTYSGKFVTRIPRTLHRLLVEQAEREGVSLNALVNFALACLVEKPALLQQYALAEPKGKYIRKGR